MTHKLKCQNPGFTAVWDGWKNCEFRKDDRGFCEGDTIELHEYLPGPESFTGRFISAKISHVQQGGRFKIPKKYCILSLKEIFTLTRLK
jgi:hypothetical protein